LGRSSPAYSFFRYCYLHGAANPEPPRPEDALLENKPPAAPAPPSAEPGSGGSEVAPSTAGPEDEIELITDFAWRNFFAAINFVHILQKLTKRKVHRVLLLTQYKAQVRPSAWSSAIDPSRGAQAILKRILKISQPLLQLYLLKLIKSQVPYSGRKWRQCAFDQAVLLYRILDSRRSQHEGHHGHLPQLSTRLAR
jgi:hypothetical protein